MSVGAVVRRFGRRRIDWIERLIVVALIAAGATVALLQDQRLWRLDAIVADTFQRAKPRVYDPNLPVRIVAIDSESLKRFGQWPWPRPYFAELVRQLNAMGAAAIAFDVVFAEPDRTSPDAFDATRRLLEASGPQAVALPSLNRHDAEFAAAISKAPVAMAAVPTPSRVAPEPMQRKYGLVVAGGDPRPRMRTVAGLDAALPVLVSNAKGYGVGGVDLAAGGVVRRMPAFHVVGGEIAPSLAMEALRLAQQAGGYVLRSSDASGEVGGGAEPVLVDARNGAVVLPVAADGAVWMRYAGPQAARFVPFWKVLQGDPSDPLLRGALEGQIVFVAATAPGLGQQLETPLGPAQPAEIYAELLEQAITGVILQRPDWARPAEAMTLVALGLIVTLTTWRRSAWLGASVAAVGAAAVVAAAWLAFDRADLVLAPLTPAATALALYVVLTAMNYFRTLRETGAVRSQFERFVAPEVIRQLVEDPDRHLSMTGEERDLTVLFCDARGFTTFSETMEPAELIAYLNACFSELTDGVLAHGGTVDKYMGDCIMAFWNAPLFDPDHTAKAVEAIHAMHASTARLNARFESEGRPPIDFGFGLNTGPCNVGLMGSRQRLEYSCVGDTVNVASRLEGLTKTYGVWNLVTQDVADAAPDWIFAPLGTTAIRGRLLPAPIATVMGRRGEPLPDGYPAMLEALEAVQNAAPADRPKALAALRELTAPGMDGARLAAALGQQTPELAEA